MKPPSVFVSVEPIRGGVPKRVARAMASSDVVVVPDRESEAVCARAGVTAPVRVVRRYSQFGVLHAQAQRPEGWCGGLVSGRLRAAAAKFGLVKGRRFKHSGDWGDMVYGLAVVKALGGGSVLVTPHPNPKCHPRQVQTRATFNLVAPLMRQQPYVEEAVFREEYDRADADYDLNERDHDWPPGSLIAKQFACCGARPGRALRDPWLAVDWPVVLPGRPVLVHACPRKRRFNPTFPWKHVLERWGHAAAVVGTREEAEELFALCGCRVPFVATADFLELARLLAGCEVFVGSCSLPMAVAQGLGRPVVQEEIVPWKPATLGHEDALYVPPSETDVDEVDGFIASRLPRGGVRSGPVLMGCTSENHYAPDRVVRWFDYYSRLKEDMGVDCLATSSDSSVLNSGWEVPVRVGGDGKRVFDRDALNVLTCGTELPPRVDGNTYPRLWRSFARLLQAAKEARAPKLVYVESDFRVLSGRLAERVRMVESGFAAAYCPRQNFVESGLMVVCADAYDRVLRAVTSKPWHERCLPQRGDDTLEATLARECRPQAWSDLVGDRYSETGYMRPDPAYPGNVPADADFAAQADGLPAGYRGRDGRERTRLLVYYDDRRKAYAELSLPSARAYAEASGFDVVVETAVEYACPYMVKVDFLLKHLRGCDRLLYADVDLLFRPGATGVGGLFERPFGTHWDGNGVCTAFLALRNEPDVWRLLRLWRKVGPVTLGDRKRWVDQGPLGVLADNWKWVRDTVQTVPHGVVSPWGQPPGRLAVHCGTWGDGLARLRGLRWD
jgi:hypothetical protein